MTEVLREVGILNCHKDRVTSIKVANDDGSIFTTSRDKRVLQWHLTHNDNIALVVKSFEESRHYVNDVAISRANKIVAVGADSLCRIYECDSKDSIKYKAHAREVTCVAINKNDNMIVTGSMDGTIILHSTNGEPMRQLDIAKGEWVTCLDFLLEKNYVAVGCTDGILRIVDVDMWKVVETFYKGDYEKASCGSISSLSVNATGRLIAYGGKDCEVYFIDMEKGASIPPLKMSSAIAALSFALTAPIIAIATQNEIILWDVISLVALGTLPFTDKTFCTSLAWSRSTLLCGMSDGSVKVYDYSSEATE